jgi:2,3-diaminopropionate biosynthesis protein SbnB
MFGDSTVPSFAVVPGTLVYEVIGGQEKRVVEVIENAYRIHGAGDTVNPASYFLGLRGRPQSRIIALPASVGGDVRADGLKWISSFPTNVRAGLPRASAVLVLNDQQTGYPLCCMEGSIISAARTAAFATLGARWLSRGRPRLARIGFCGTGLIARYIHTYLTAEGWTFDEVGIYDAQADSAAGFQSYLEQSPGGGRITVHRGAESLIRSCDLIVFATIAPRPHITERAWLEHNPLILHISLRDLAPEIVLDAVNVVDDVAHCLTANTSLHLAEQAAGNRAFVTGTLHDVMVGAVQVEATRPVVFSPFGLGVLDIALGKHVYDQVRENGQLAPVDGFFHELQRHERPAQTGVTSCR